MSEVTSDPQVHMRHIRQARLCSKGVREWWVAHGLDWSDFLNAGIPAKKLEATGDPYAIRVAGLARDEADGR